MSLVFDVEQSKTGGTEKAKATVDQEQLAYFTREHGDWCKSWSVLTVVLLPLSSGTEQGEERRRRGESLGSFQEQSLRNRGDWRGERNS